MMKTKNALLDLFGSRTPFLCILLILALAGCMSTTTAPDGTVTEERKEPPGFIGGQKGDAKWMFVVDLGIIEPIQIGFTGFRKSVPVPVLAPVLITPGESD